MKSSTATAPLGSVPTHLHRLQELQAAGVTQFNIYLMSGEENTLDMYGRDIIPALTLEPPAVDGSRR